MEALAQLHTVKFIRLLSRAEIFIHSQVVKVHRQPSDIVVNTGDACHFQESVYLAQCEVHLTKKQTFSVSIEEIASNLNANILRSSSRRAPTLKTLMYLCTYSLNELKFRKWWIISLLDVAARSSTLHLQSPMCFTPAWWTSVPASRPGIFCTGEVTLARMRWHRKHSRGSDVEIKAGGGRLPHCTPYLYISLFHNPGLQHPSSSHCQHILKGPQH